MALPREVEDRIGEIRQNRTAGAVELAKQAAGALILLAAQPGYSRSLLEEAARALVAAQPAMAPMFNLANRVLFHEAGEAVAVCRNFVRALESAGAAVALLAGAKIEDRSTVMTHSFSATVLSALLAARQTGKRFEVICTESRPLCEGATLAKRLGQAGIPVKLIVDAAMPVFLPGARVVLVGADSISRRGLVNKTGTLSLALAARALGVGMYALCGSEKSLPDDYSPPPQPLRDESEILDEPAANVTVLNYYFDSTPLGHLAGAITEDGILSPDQLSQRLSGLRVHNALRLTSG